MRSRDDYQRTQQNDSEKRKKNICTQYPFHDLSAGCFRCFVAWEFHFRQSIEELKFTPLSVAPTTSF